MAAALLSVLLMMAALAQCSPLSIGGFYHDGDGLSQEVAFKYAVERVNSDSPVLRDASPLKPYMFPVNPMDSFNIGKQTCKMASHGVAAVFGPHSEYSTGIVRSICEKLEIPNMVTNWEAGAPSSQMTVNLHPDPESLSQALADLVKEMSWRSYTILYETEEALVRLQGILQAREPWENPITVRQLREGDDNRPLLKEIKNSTETRIILDCGTEKTLQIMRQAVEVKLMDVYNSYLITNLDAHTVDFTEFRGTGANITTLRLVDPSSTIVQTAVRDWFVMEERLGRHLNISPYTVKTETALMYDAVLLFAHTVGKLNKTERIDQWRLNCNDSRKWKHGLAITNYMQHIKMTGMTGDIHLDSQGRRTNFSLDVLEYTQREGFKKTGTWDLENRFRSIRSYKDIEVQISDNLQNKTIIVSSRIGPPFLMMRKNKDPPCPPDEGNHCFEGFSVDLIEEISKILKFKYKFVMVPDKQYGSFDKVKQEWNGLLGELIKRRADLALCDLTITYDRERAVDFTMPFMNLGISILYKKAEKAETNLFSFLEPFSIDVWIYMATAYLGVSVLLFVLARATPHEWDNPHPCNPDPEELENSFNMINCLWFSMGSLMGQGCDILPKAVSTRMAAGMWWFFTLIMISSYTANLAAFLTVTRMDAKINNVEDLAKQTKIKYGTYGKGSTASFFRNSNVSLYQRMWTVMQQARPDVFTSGNDEGVDRVKKGKGDYAFFMESTMIEYQMERNCDLVQVGGLLDSKGYGIAMPVDSPYRKKVNGAVLELQEKGMLKVLKDRWWKAREGEGETCEADDAEEEDSAELGLSNVGGVFLVLFFGCTAAFLVSILEFLWNCRKIAVEEKITPLEAMAAELKFAVTLSADTKPVRKKPPEADDTDGGSFMQLQLNYDKYGVEPK